MGQKGKRIKGSGEGEARDATRCRGRDKFKVGGGVVGKCADSGEVSGEEPERDSGDG